MSKRLAFLAATLVLLVSACGSSNSAKNENTTTSTSTIDSADQTAAKKMVLVDGDLPSGWVVNSTDQTTNNLAAGIYDQLSTCLGVPNATADRTVLYSGNSYSNSSNAISSGASGFKTAATPATEVKGIKDSANYPCINKLLDTFVGQLAGAGSTAAPTSTLAPIDGVKLADNQFGLRVTTAITIGSAAQTIYTDLIGVNSGRFVSTASINYFGSVPPVSLDAQVLTALTTHTTASAS